MVLSSSISSSERSRLNLIEFLHAFLGCFLQGWNDAASDTSRAISWLSHVSHVLNEATSTGDPEAKLMVSGDAELSWFNLLLQAARYHLDCKSNDKVIAKKLIFLGRKFGKLFLGLPKLPIFGLLRRGSFVSLVCSEDDQINFLREDAQDVARELRLQNYQMFIRYKHGCAESSKTVYKYATARPLTRSSTKRKTGDIESNGHSHCRWLYAGENDLRTRRLSDDRFDRRLREHFSGLNDGN